LAVKFEYAYSSSSRWVDTLGTNQSMGDRNAILKYARDNGWEMITVSEGTMYFKKPVA
jgi:predicted nucleotidyltransferase